MGPSPWCARGMFVPLAWLTFLLIGLVSGCDARREAGARVGKAVDGGHVPVRAAAKGKGPALKGGGEGPAPAAGLLTAGSFDDHRRFEVFQAFLKKMDRTYARDLPSRFTGRRLVVRVENEAGEPIHNARVQVKAGRGAQVDLLARTDGRAIVVTPWDALDEDSNWTVTVTSPFGGAPVQRVAEKESEELTVILPGSAARLPEALDLAFVIDTTGSMGDELAYLKSEMKWIVNAIQMRFPKVRQRYALICYRDQGDEYVTRTFGFTESLDAFTKNLGAQHAQGGGDFPEAVHKGIEQATHLDWSSGATARVVIHVADAPPHAANFEQSLTRLDRLRKAGVVYYPLAASGYDPSCEFLMRSGAVLTGAEFLFLTDDSGIGNAHAEPTTSGYHVESLNRLLVRMIAGELSGRRIEPRPEEILRTVGDGPGRGAR